MGRPQRSGHVELPVRHGRRQPVLGKMVQGRPRVLPIYARPESKDARVQHGRRKRGREYRITRAR